MLTTLSIVTVTVVVPSRFRWWPERSEPRRFACRHERIAVGMSPTIGVIRPDDLGGDVLSFERCRERLWGSPPEMASVDPSG